MQESLKAVCVYGNIQNYDKNGGWTWDASWLSEDDHFLREINKRYISWLWLEDQCKVLLNYSRLFHLGDNKPKWWIITLQFRVFRKGYKYIDCAIFVW